MGNTPDNIILIGMPGAGKSTIGAILARMTARGFIDSDTSIQIEQGRPLYQIIEQEGYVSLRDIEERIILKISARNQVIATGGSAIYSRPAMQHLAKQGTVVFLDVSLTTLESRIHDFEARGLANPSNQTLEEIFIERQNLYAASSDIRISCDGLNPSGTCKKIIEAISDYEPQDL